VRFPPFAYLSYLGEKQYYKEVASAGIHLYNFPVYLGDRGINSTSGIGPFRQSIWTGENEYDYSSIIEDFEKIIEVDPQAKVILRIHLDPPQWWEKVNPHEVCMLPDGQSLRTSFFSKKWQSDAGKTLKDCINWLLKSQYARYFAGVHIAGGFTEEWFYHFNQYFFDENPARTTGFRDWLREKYANDVDKLKKTWNNPDVTFETAQLSDISGVHTESKWRQPTDQQAFDTFDFHAETLVNHIIYFCKIVKDESDGCLLTGAFNGYHYFVTDPKRGHGALTKLLKCNDLDFLSSPNDYYRVIGEDWPPMSAIQSVQKHGKLWLAENDTRTTCTTLLKDRAPHLVPPNGGYDGGVWLGPTEMETSVSFLWKNLARMYAGGYGGWWFDMWGGWFSHPQLMEVLQKGQDLFRWYPDEEMPAMKPEIGVIVDERLQFWDESYGGLTSKITSNRYSLAKTGAPYDLYLRADLDSLPVSSYKIVWLMGIPDITDHERQYLDEMIKRGMVIMLTDTVGTEIKSLSLEKKYPGKYSWTAAELGEIWQDCHVHRYIKTEDVLYAGRGWIGIHSADGGEKEIKLKFKAHIINVINSEMLVDATNVVKINMKPKSTVLFRVFPENRRF
jgi:beta-galactosidase